MKPQHWCAIGAGIGGLALALAWSQHPLAADLPLTVFEQIPEPSEVGAGIQLGPNATRCLVEWGLQDELLPLVSAPERIQARNQRGQVVGELDVATRMIQRYGSPYWTLHRADLHQVLLRAVEQAAEVTVLFDQPVLSVQHSTALPQHELRLKPAHVPKRPWSAVVGADGVWSQVRHQCWPQRVLQDSGQLAYRALAPMSDVPSAWRLNQVTVWMMPHLHVVMYPIRAGTVLNVAVLIQQASGPTPLSWDERAGATLGSETLSSVVHQCPADLRAVLEVVRDWRTWPLVVAPPLRGWQDMALNTVALLGDAAHPMLPYMGQGAGMALEDAQTLVALASRFHRSQHTDWSAWFKAYAQARWSRCSRVQRKAQRNGVWFHASGLRALARDVGLSLNASAVMDVPWLYKYQAEIA